MSRTELLANMASRYFARSMNLVQDTQLKHLWSVEDCIGYAETMLEIIEAKYGRLDDATAIQALRGEGK